MLQDLGEILNSIPTVTTAFLKKDEVPERFLITYAEYLGTKGNQNVFWAKTSFATQTLKGLNVVFPFQWFYLAALLVPFGKELIKYKSKFTNLCENNNLSSVVIKVNVKKAKDFKKLSDEFNMLIDGSDLAENDKALMTKFLCDYNWWNGSKTVDRSDFFGSALLSAIKVVQVTSGYISDIVEAYIERPDIFALLNFSTDDLEGDVLNIAPPLQSLDGENVIIYGAPGTGKSHEANKLPNVTRTVFHSDTSYQDFIGSYRPCKMADDSFSYEFVAGPFVTTLVKALNDPTTPYTLLIEEINRANCGAVFGEVFQLLDRDSSCISKYPIPPEQALSNYMDSAAPGWVGELRIPSNLSIYATMNSADQGVFPMDSAFKRRWKFKYIKINFENAAHRDKIVSYAGSHFTWKEFAERINSQLSMLGINEDRHIGPYFITPEEIQDTEAITSKLMIYLWDDVVRHQRNSFFLPKFSTFATLIESYMNGEPVFSFWDGVSEDTGLVNETAERANNVLGDQGE